MRLVAAMNENGLPGCNITNISSPVNTSSLNGIQSSKYPISTSQSIVVENKGNVIHSTNMSNGGIIYAPVPVQHQNGFPGNDILRQIIAHDVHHPNTIKTGNVNSRDMVIKTAPHGAVQITYRKMIHSLPEYKKPIHILPKPTTKDNKSLFAGQSAYVNSSKSIDTNNSIFSKTHSKLLNNYCIGNNLSSSFPSVVSSSMPQCTTQVNDINSNFISSTGALNGNILNSMNTPSSGGKLVEGNSKNLSINLPKIKKSPVVAALQLTSEPNLINSDKSLYTPLNEENNFELNQAPNFDDNYEMEDVNDFIPSSHNSNLSNGDLSHMSDLDMNLLSMDIDSLDAITMTTFLQNETLFDTDPNGDYSLPTTSMMNSVNQTSDNSSLMTSSNATIDYSVNTNDSVVVNLVNQSIQPEIPNTVSMDAFECNSSLDINFKISTDNQKIVDTSSTNVNMDNRLMNIIDVSPDMSTTLGGCKIILIGSWNAKDSRYSCKFGDEIVSAELIQNGVLRCYSPKHTAGKIKLCVLSCDGVCSNEVDFQIINPTDTTDEKSTKHNEWMSITTKSLVMGLIDRISDIADIIGVSGLSKELAAKCKCTDTEGLKQCQEQLVGICKRLMVENVNFSFEYDVENSMTVLHLAAALGFTKFIQLLLKWVESNPNKLIMVEACPTRLDQFSLLPIMWSSAKGHFNTTCVLHQWVESTIEEVDACGCTAIDLAKECGHETIAEYLERLQKKSNACKETVGQAEELDHAAASNSLETQQLLVSSNMLPQDADGSSSRTLGKTLARIQSMISDQDDVSNLQELNLDGEESLFETSPFTPRQRSVAEENIVSLNVHSQNSPASTSTSSPSPFNRQTFQTAEFCEFFYKAKKIEKDFAELTLTDEEQQDLLRAANVIQSAYKTYKERRKRRDQEFCAAVLIQSYYRRYKQYAAFKKMQKGALVIQNQYRAHREKSKKKVKAASTIQAYYRRYREKKNDSHDDVQMKNKLQQQADRKVNRYLMQTSTRFSKEFPDNFVNDGNSSTSPEPS